MTDTSTGHCQSLSIPCIPSSSRALVFSLQCLVAAACRWCGPPLRQTSIAEIRVGWLLKRFSHPALWARWDALFLSSFRSICLSKGQSGEGVLTWLGLLMLAADSFQLISTFLSWASNTVVFLDFDLILASLLINNKRKTFCTIGSKNKRKSFIYCLARGRFIRCYGFFLWMILGPKQ